MIELHVFKGGAATCQNLLLHTLYSGLGWWMEKICGYCEMCMLAYLLINFRLSSYHFWDVNLRAGGEKSRRPTGLSRVYIFPGSL